jgi:type I restriction enzyme M protein
MTDTLGVRRDKGRIWSPIRNKWLLETPEESVRQEYLCTLVNEYGYSLSQIDEEVSAPGERGTKDARADFVVWRSTQDRLDGNTALIVVECKADNVIIDQKVYVQGSNYAQFERAKFFVTHNRRSTKFWKVSLEKRAPNYSEVKDIPHANDSDKQIEELLSKLRPFEGKEFADLLHQCHNVIRNNEHLDPAAAFDEIAKLLFIKVWVERRLKEKKERKNIFTVEFLKNQLSKNPIQSLFEETKEFYRGDKIFDTDERINLRAATVEAIVSKLTSYNLSETSEDVKGIAFERFLGGTFRGEIGQFFTPRPIVEFMVRMMEPREGDRICDPASGSGGFLIRFFEVIREAIAADVDRRYRDYCDEIDRTKDSEVRKAQKKLERYKALQKELDPGTEPDGAQHIKLGSRIWTLANRCIYGTDANDRMARTSKMNMIMHGDGHGGVHHHNGLLNVNGIFEGRFSLILTNPPFGATVADDNVVLSSDYLVSQEARTRYRSEYGKDYDRAIERVTAAVGKPILSLFQLPTTSRIKTELLFVERCLDLLEPGGRLGIVLPEGVFNNPNALNVRVREFVENRSRILAVVGLPPDTFKSTGADVKASILFLQKFTIDEQIEYDRLLKAARISAEKIVGTITNEEIAELKFALENAQKVKRLNERAILRQRIQKAEQVKNTRIELEGKRLLRTSFDYPIFMYEAEYVGINATGEACENELYPNEHVPASCEKTCLELYKEFRQNPSSFYV